MIDPSSSFSARNLGLRIGTPDGGSRAITDEEWAAPVYFEASRKQPHASWGKAAQSSFPLYGFIPSLYIGTHAGWIVSGKQYPREAFHEHHFGGCFTGAAPVGLTPLISI